MIIYVRKMSIYYRRCDMNINIYFGERPRVLHGRLITIENCQHMQHVIDVPNELNDIKSHVISHRFELQLNRGAYLDSVSAC
jgi:hypothetical protein